MALWWQRLDYCRLNYCNGKCAFEDNLEGSIGTEHGARQMTGPNCYAEVTWLYLLVTVVDQVIFCADTYLGPSTYRPTTGWSFWAPKLCKGCPSPSWRVLDFSCQKQHTPRGTGATFPSVLGCWGSCIRMQVKEQSSQQGSGEENVSAQKTPWWKTVIGKCRLVFVFGLLCGPTSGRLSSYL